MRPVDYTPFVPVVKTTDSYATCYQRRHLQSYGTRYQSEPDHTTFHLRRKLVARLVWDIDSAFQVLQSRGLLIGMTVDSVNDTPTLKKANVGIPVEAHWMDW